ncbi:MAG: DUF2933 domain-containing protein [Proteobacteria bacterium]|jgi:hypothetical protein|nr:DUF2933 domain-containing protein [Pseudomonadota bacterium]
MNDDLRGTSWTARARLALIGFAVIGGFLLLTEHWAHALPYLPWLLLAACPLMHILHGGHGHGGHPEGGQDRAGGGSVTPPHEHGRRQP